MRRIRKKEEEEEMNMTCTRAGRSSVVAEMFLIVAAACDENSE